MFINESTDNRRLGLPFRFTVTNFLEWILNIKPLIGDILYSLFCKLSVGYIFRTLDISSGKEIGKELACQCRRWKRLSFNPWIGKIPWSRKWQHTPGFLPGKSHGQRSQVGYSPCGGKESDMTECITSVNEGRGWRDESTNQGSPWVTCNHRDWRETWNKLSFGASWRNQWR